MYQINIKLKPIMTPMIKKSSQSEVYWLSKKGKWLQSKILQESTCMAIWSYRLLSFDPINKIIRQCLTRNPEKYMHNTFCRLLTALLSIVSCASYLLLEVTFQLVHRVVFLAFLHDLFLSYASIFVSFISNICFYITQGRRHNVLIYSNCLTGKKI